MATPGFQDFFIPMLKICSDGKNYTLKEIRTKLGSALNLSEKDFDEKIPSGTDTKFNNRTTWTKTYLTKAGALETINRGLFKITQRGKSLLIDYPNGIKIKDLQLFPEFQEFQKRTNQNTDEIPTEEQYVTPEEQLDNASNKINNSTATELLKRILQNSPSFFEKLIIDLMIKMGYGGPQINAGQALGQTGDGGVDGLINQDELGLDVIYLQAKRWENNSVGRPEIQKFAGALMSKKTKKGVFITTSDFTKEALEYARSIDTKIVLINGHQLALHMLNHNLGVTNAKTIQIKKIDSDYFEEE